LVIWDLLGGLTELFVGADEGLGKWEFRLYTSALRLWLSRLKVAHKTI